MQYGKLAGLLAAVGVAVGGGVWLSGKQLDGAAQQAPQAQHQQSRQQQPSSAQALNQVAVKAAQPQAQAVASQDPDAKAIAAQQRAPVSSGDNPAEVMLRTMGDVMATMGGTVARVADTFIVVISGEVEQTKKLAAGEGGDELADVVRQMAAREDLERPGLKGPIRRFMDKYCILGYLTGKGTCDR